MQAGVITPIVRVERPPMLDTEKLVFSSIDFLLQAVKSRLTPDILKQVQAEFGSYLEKTQYPVLEGNRLIDFLSSACLAELSTAAARQVFGKYYVTRYQKTIQGQLLMRAVPLVNLGWAIRGLPRNFAAATNYGTYWVAELAQRHWQLEFEDDPGYPDLILGILLGSKEILKASSLQLSYTVLAPQHTSFDIQW